MLEKVISKIQNGIRTLRDGSVIARGRYHQEGNGLFCGNFKVEETYVKHVLGKIASGKKRFGYYSSDGMDYSPEPLRYTFYKLSGFEFEIRKSGSGELCE